MIILITGASHAGKTFLAQKLLEKYKYPYMSADHLKMGLIRSGSTHLTPEDDDELTGYLWPIIREIIKTAIENKQDFDEKYLRFIRFICLAMSDHYIDSHYGQIREHGSDIEARLDDTYCTVDRLKEDNRRFIAGFRRAGEQVTVITESFEESVRELLD